MFPASICRPPPAPAPALHPAFKASMDKGLFTVRLSQNFEWTNALGGRRSLNFMTILGLLPGLYPAPAFPSTLLERPQLRASRLLFVELSETNFEPATFRSAVVCPTIVGEMALSLPRSKSDEKGRSFPVTYVPGFLKPLRHVQRLFSLFVRDNSRGKTGCKAFMKSTPGVGRSADMSLKGFHPLKDNILS
jgi:hypothetical protein